MRSGVTLSMIADVDSFVSHPGNKIHLLYDSVLNKYGDIDLVENGRVDIDNLINSFGETTDMNYIMARLTAGDSSVLNVRPVFYADVSNLPNDHRSAMDTIMNAQQYFDHLDTATKLKFDNDFTKWISSAGTPAWIQRMMPREMQENIQKSSNNGTAAAAAAPDPNSNSNN